MARDARAELDLEELAQKLKEARNRRGWTLRDLRDALKDIYPTSLNKLWRLENERPGRLDAELLVWLQHVLDVQLLPTPNRDLVPVDDVLKIIESFREAIADGPDPPHPETPEMRTIQKELQKLLQVHKDHMS